MTNNAIPNKKTGFRPMLSASFPYKGVETAVISSGDVELAVALTIPAHVDVAVGTVALSKGGEGIFAVGGVLQAPGAVGVLHQFIDDTLAVLFQDGGTGPGGTDLAVAQHQFGLGMVEDDMKAVGGFHAGGELGHGPILGLRLQTCHREQEEQHDV